MGKPVLVVAYLMVCFAIVATAQIVYNSTVSTVEPGAFRSIRDALKAAPINSKTKYYIHVTKGTYVERVEVLQNMTNIVLIGDGASITKVQWNRHAPDFGTDETGTITISGEGFIAMNITFENTAGDVGQAAAAVVTADHVAFYECTFRGFQDTLYAKSGIQFYKKCDIYGTVDFIFGAAAAVFQSCNMYADKPRTIAFTAQSKDNPELTPPSGFVIQDSRLTVSPELEPQRPQFNASLGRPWRQYSTVVVMESYLDSIIQPAGWTDFEGRTHDFVFYREYNNDGPGANTRGRVKWPGYRDVTGKPDLIKNYTVAEFINKDGWLNETRIPFSDGFIKP